MSPIAKQFTWLFLIMLMTSQGNAQSLLANVGPVTIDYGAVNAGASATVKVNFRNLTATPLTISGGGFGEINGFNNTNSGTCGGSVPASGTCYMNYIFRPLSANGVLYQGHTDVYLFDGTRSQRVPINLTGSGSGSLVEVTPRVIHFGSWTLGVTTVVQVTATNLGDRAVTFAGGGFSAQNGFNANSGTCNAGLMPGATCNFNYSFTAGQAGLLTNTTSITAITAAPSLNQQYSISLSGTGLATVPAGGIGPIELDFGDVPVGRQVYTVVKLSNFGNGALAADLPDFNPDSYPTFGSSGLLSANGCSAISHNLGVVASGATCGVNHTFQPSEPGVVAGERNIGFAGSYFTVRVSGRGVGVAGQVSPLKMHLGKVQLGTSHSAKVTITNSTSYDWLNFLGGAVNPPFSSTHNCASPLISGASCEVTFSFQASSGSVGLRSTATLISFSSLYVHPVYTIELSAEGYDTTFGNGFE